MSRSFAPISERVFPVGEELTESWTVTERTIPFRTYETWIRISEPNTPRPDALPVVVLHGGPGMAHNYMLPFERLAAAGRTVIHYDQLGCGNSTHLPDSPAEFWTPDLFVEEFFNLAASLGLDEFHVLGQSWGGMLAAEIAVRQPAALRSVSILNSPASMALWVQAAAELRLKLPAGMNETMSKYEAAGKTNDAEYLSCVDEFYRRHVCRVEPTPKEFVDSTKQMEAEPTVYHTMNGPNEFHVIGSLKDWSIVEELPKVNRPTLVLAGEYDEATPATWTPFVNKISDVRSVVIDGASHCAHLEQPAVVLRIVNDFLADHDS
ncbi:proline iminopeptidase-family hydrolase [Brevibacterium linens]|uniref:proline iminopeptidase-family hydrolase n=1 Tax=Brevibacterium linens TaxID=1703 RepID=UPI0009E2DB8D|nr:proline iminopeptidase-family hydrolase [Brevibacterium linens]